jgi:glyoxylase-like metal-dependent hydrolase (beta-lactamase superfamily II)
LKIHYLNCGTMHPRLAGLFAPQLDRTPCICLLIECRDRLILVDTGLGTRDMEDFSRLGHLRLILNPLRDPEQTAIRQVERLGYHPKDVAHIICTHLDRDHAGGLSDFPWAKVHVSSVEQKAAMNPKTAPERERYRKCQLSHGPDWAIQETASGDDWFGIERVREIPGLPPEILLVPLHGHTRGHCGVAVRRDDGGWLLHCGDAYYVKEELRLNGKAPAGVRRFRCIAHVNHPKAMSQIEKLKGLLNSTKTRISMISSHDQYEYRNLFGRLLD